MEDIEQYYTSRVSQSDDLFWQVGKTVNGKPVGNEQLSLIVNRIKQVLELNTRDTVLDMGCGNGLVTNEIASSVGSIIGVERNRPLFEKACKHASTPNQQFKHADILEFVLDNLIANKAFTYEVVQHIEHHHLKMFLLRMRSTLSEAGSLFIGGIPDEEKKWAFYNTAQRKSSLSASLAETGRDPVGTWYYQDFFYYLADEFDCSVTILQQPSELYTSHYRFDCLVEF